MKKHYFLFILTMCMLFMVSACKKAGFLDPKTEPLTEAKVFADSTLTFNFLNGIYLYVGQDVIPSRYGKIKGLPGNEDAGLDDLTTNSASGYSDPQATFMTGSSTSSNGPFFNYWSNYYTRIRATNLFMKNIGTTKISAAKKIRLAAEARFLRAFYYEALIRIFGGVQLMGDDVTDELPTDVYKRNTYKECVDYTVKEFDEAAKNLPNVITQEAADYGRATSDACMALKARLLLTAASPLFNGSPIATDALTGPLVAYSISNDQTLWQKSADAFKAVIDMGHFGLVEDNITRPGHGFWKMFVKGRKNKEYIFSYMIARGKDLENRYFPRSRSGRNDLSFSNPSENIVKAFGMKNGKSIDDPNAGYDATNPYNGRDPRFNFSIIYNQAPIWKNGSGTTLVPVDIYFNAATNALTADGLQSFYTRTGYYSRKMCNDSTGVSSDIDRAYPIIRYAEVLLGYAECLNELGNTSQAVDYVKMIRNRAGIDPGSDGRYGIANGISQSDLRKLIQNEYRVEFFQEGHWYYDTRRWKTAADTENQPLTGMSITKERSGIFTYRSVVVLNSSFQNPKMYLAPIPLNEVLKSNDMIQNPGW